MLKRRSRETIVSLFFCVGWAFAGAIRAPEKTVPYVEYELIHAPLPKLSVAEALGIAKELMRNPPAAYPWARSDNYTIVAIDWCKASDFQPRFTDGSTWSVLDDKDAYAWFVTYLEPNQDIQTRDRAPRSVWIIRIKDNGKADFMVGIRT